MNEDGMKSTFETRIEFAEALSRVEIGMTSKSVLEHIDSPQQVRPFDQEWYRYTDASLPSGREGVHIWCYGVDDSHSLPTLGQIWFSNEGIVREIYGGSKPIFSEEPQASKTVGDEPTLRELLRTVDATSSSGGWEYNPLRTIQIVNALQPLGKNVVLALMREYLRVAPIQLLQHTMIYGGIALILRTLFTSPSSELAFPCPALGVPVPGYSTNHIDLPVFPIYLPDDIPFNVVPEYWCMSPTSIEGDFQFCHAQCDIRQFELHPSDNPFESLNRSITISCANLESNEARDRLMLKRSLSNQLVRLICNVYPMPSFEHTIPDGDLQSQLEAHANAFSKLNADWDSTVNNYIRRN